MTSPYYPPPRRPSSNDQIPLIVIAATLMGMLMLWVGWNWLVAAAQWHECGASTGGSIIAPISEGKPSVAQCLELEYAKQTRTNP